MLVLSRKQDQEILIGDQIKITVLKTRGNTVRLGIEAPRDIHVVRGELESPSRDGGSTEQDTAEFTVVFGSADSEATPDQDGDIETVQFDVDYSGDRARRLAPSAVKRLPPQDAESKATTDANEDTIRFQGQLPKVFQRNRLKDIVDRIASEGKK